ncbi:hypothetical protein ACR30L_11375 [Psychromonas sp. PT13]|uniref:hypothetical protein n=1 Tax=Psychromonas sp. PT13 TaxID=3439547 RepID=UPI003EB86979
MMILKQAILMITLGFSAIALVGCGSSTSSNDSVDYAQTETLADIDSNYVDLHITWLDNSDNEVEFIIERRIESNVDYGTTYYVEENTTSFDDIDVQSGETYCYRVSASNDVGVSHSSEVCIDV